MESFQDKDYFPASGSYDCLLMRWDNPARKEMRGHLFYQETSVSTFMLNS